MLIKGLPMSNENLNISQTATHEGQSTRCKNLIFTLADERYGIPLSSVKEVICMTDITPVPHVPTFFKGLINLRGKIISIIDLRAKLGLSMSKYEPKKTSIIIVDVQDWVLGAIVDDVSEVAGFEQKQIEQHLDIQSSVSSKYITGVAKTTDKKLVLLLDIGSVLSVEELAIIKERTKL